MSSPKDNRRLGMESGKVESLCQVVLIFSEKMAVTFYHEAITDNKAIQEYVQKEY